MLGRMLDVRIDGVSTGSFTYKLVTCTRRVRLSPMHARYLPLLLVLIPLRMVGCLLAAFALKSLMPALSECADECCCSGLDSGRCERAARLAPARSPAATLPRSSAEEGVPLPCASPTKGRRWSPPFGLSPMPCTRGPPPLERRSAIACNRPAAPAGAAAAGAIRWINSCCSIWFQWSGTPGRHQCEQSLVGVFCRESP